jgi:LPS-assembly protein
MPEAHLRSFLFAVLCLFSAAASADDVSKDTLVLKTSPELKLQTIPTTEPTPMFIEAERIQGHHDKELECFGDVRMRKRNESLTADYLFYDQEEDEILAKGNVRLKQKNDVMAGPELKLKLEDHRGYMESPHFELAENNARGDADKLLFEGEDHYRFLNSLYTTCPIGRDDWFLDVGDLELDRTTQVGTAHHAFIKFKGVPLLYTPWMDFPLSNQRKSGFLAPSAGSTNKSGGEITLPYYWNIAANMDATFSPRLMARRGLQLMNEFRYLEPTYNGIANLEILPNDNVTHTNRSFFAVQHNQSLLPGLAGTVNLQRASDDNYFRDLSTAVAATSQTFLPREGTLTYTQPMWNVTTRVQNYQTLQDPLAPVSPPYFRTPQIVLNAAKPNADGFDLALAGEYVHFGHPTLVNGQRLMLNPSITYPMHEVYGFFIPKIGLHVTHYGLNQTGTVLSDTTRTLPIFSADSGLYFERDSTLFGNTFLHTLEPRLYYVYIPYKDQNQIPIFDSGEAGLSLAQLFSENQFSGIDRINDANQLTAAVTSRLVEPKTGIERLRTTIAQRFYFKDQQVTLSTPARTRSYSDLLLTLGGQITPAWFTDSLIQYNPEFNRMENATLSGRYQPQPGSILNLAYRYNRDTLKHLDASAQWPLSGRWYGVGRLDYSLLDRQPVEALGGLEYNAGCWMLRAVVQRLANSTVQATNSIFLQLELNGVSKIGSNPLDVLKQNISGYTKINQTVQKPYEF